MASFLLDWMAPRSPQSRPDTPDTVSTLRSGLDWPAARSLKIISLGISSVSLLAGSLSIYWLVRMRRSFRHDLILLLITSDFVKSLSFVIYSSTTLSHFPSMDSGSTFCQVSGFFFSMSIEASDAAVFLIALHWTIYIFRSNRAGRESGIYPYRYLSFAFYILFPILMASLAFSSGYPAYVDTGQLCYLPATPWWYRMSLSWIPRYVNMALIIGMYCASYVYIRITMRRFCRQHPSISTSHRERRMPDTPPLICHGLIPSPLESRRISFRVPAGSSLGEGYPGSLADEGIGFRESLRQRLDRLSVSSIRSRSWPWQGFDWEPEIGAKYPSSGLVSPRTGTAQPTTEFSETEYKLQPPKPSLSPLKRGGAVQSQPSRPSLSRGRKSLDFFRRPISTTMEADGKVASNMLNIGRSRHFTSSQMHIYTVLQQGPRRESEAESAPDSPIVSLEYDTLESDGISRGRDRTRRQLRLLFIYPAVYACVWVFPSVSDVIGYDEHHSHSQYWLLVASLVSLCAQGLADSIVFCFRERPWRHVRGGFWENLGVGFTNGLSFDSRNETGRNREEMFHDGSRARLRRKGEQVRERASRVSPSEMSSQVLASRNWWDVELDGDEDFRSRDTMSRGRRMARVSDAWRPEQRAD